MEKRDFQFIIAFSSTRNTDNLKFVHRVKFDPKEADLPDKRAFSLEKCGYNSFSKTVFKEVIVKEETDEEFLLGLPSQFTGWKFEVSIKTSEYTPLFNSVLKLMNNNVQATDQRLFLASTNMFFNVCPIQGENTCRLIVKDQNGEITEDRSFIRVKSTKFSWFSQAFKKCEPDYKKVVRYRENPKEDPSTS